MRNGLEAQLGRVGWILKAGTFEPVADAAQRAVNREAETRAATLRECRQQLLDAVKEAGRIWGIGGIDDYYRRIADTWEPPAASVCTHGWIRVRGKTCPRCAAPPGASGENGDADGQ